MDDGTAHPEIHAAGLTQPRDSKGGAARARSRSRSTRRSGRRRGGGRNTDDNKKETTKTYTHTEAGCPICPGINNGTCKEIKSTSGKGKGKGKGDKKPEGANCPNGKAHVCSKCRGRHSAKHCTVKDY